MSISIENGHLNIGGADAVALAQEYGTPLYVMDEEIIRSRCRTFKNALEEATQGRCRVIYASKAFNCMEMCRIVKDEGLGIDVVSGGELYTAIKAGFDPEKIYFHGNNKSLWELTLSLDNSVGRIVVDNINELTALNALAGEKGKTTDIMFRIKPGVDAHTHDFVKTGQIDSKFGVALETGEAMDIVKAAHAMDNVRVAGIHCHIGSQIFDTEPFVTAADVMMDFMAQVKKEIGLTIGELNLGGGFGISYTGEDNPRPYEEYMVEIANEVQRKANELSMDVPFLLVEPGRSIVGSSGVTLYTVGSVKNIPNIRTYVSVNGGMTDNPRFALYQSKYTMTLANKADKPRNTVVTVAGKCCESGDLLGENIELQQAEAGDILAVLSTGAYNYSMSSNYNRTPKPACVMVNNGQVRTVIKGETLDDIIRNDV